MAAAPAAPSFTFEDIIERFRTINLAATTTTGLFDAPPPPLAFSSQQKQPPPPPPPPLRVVSSQVFNNALVRLRYTVFSVLEQTLALTTQPPTPTPTPTPAAVSAYARGLEECVFYRHFCNGATRPRQYINDACALVALLQEMMNLDNIGGDTSNGRRLPLPHLLVERVHRGAGAVAVASASNVGATGDLNRDMIDRLFEEANVDSECSQVVTCSKCRVGPVRFTSRQTRSADEAMTVFMVCLNCGKRWKS